MSADWETLCRETGLKFSGDEVKVPCGRNRFQSVFIDNDASDEAIRIWSLVVRRRHAVANAALECWKMNRYRELVGFKLVGAGRVIGESWVPRAGLTTEEWLTYVHTLARSCDRLEYLWTGRDET